ncbi:unnamed protein product [Spirodela intermedia]|uniref:Uncharacterized protein n=1 Tax=Spirodela intermedia TaxID=51605 RepID=A0A7I8IVL5_SPIIN|nr:unnamed protein product [Spirodela intermedia]CAA6661819.1 unnamed protein product [Spirodela intermedia]
MFIEHGDSRLAEAPGTAMTTTTTAAAAVTKRSLFSSWREVSYRLPATGSLLLPSSLRIVRIQTESELSNRNTSNFGSKYGKAIKKGVISFLAIDESRFSKKEECRCVPYFISKRTWGIFRRRTKLLCQKCGNLVGVAYEEDDPSCAASESSGAAVRGSTRSRSGLCNL